MWSRRYHLVRHDTHHGHTPGPRQVSHAGRPGEVQEPHLRHEAYHPGGWRQRYRQRLGTHLHRLLFTGTVIIFCFLSSQLFLKFMFLMTHTGTMQIWFL